MRRRWKACYQFQDLGRESQMAISEEQHLLERIIKISDTK